MRMLKDNVYRNVIELVSELLFEKAYHKLSAEDCNYKNFWEFCIQNIEDQISGHELYLFLQYLYARTKKCDLLLYLAELLVYVMPFTDDPYTLAFLHISMAIQLCPNEIRYKEFLIDNFYDYPERYLQEEEWCEIAKQILKSNPVHEKAKKIVGTM